MGAAGRGADVRMCLMVRVLVVVGIWMRMVVAMGVVMGMRVGM